MSTKKSKQPQASDCGQKPWLKHYDFWVPAEINFPRQPIYQILDLAALQFTERPATAFGEAQLTFAEIKAQADRLATSRMDEDGYFYIVQRKKDMIIVSGFNVYPNEVEDVLFTHPAVKEAAVIGVPCAYRGEAVKAFIIPKPGAQALAEELIGHCREHLARYKVPAFIEFVESLPKSAIGKVLRRELREAEEAGRTAQ